ncbi:hypothetical protein GGI19_001868 [Coemansia pectinata]|uniref:Uncharacterized protein n=1 Tax=Coemansia pectinata TaxID=1052879 RepID=A0A9W8H177_9FUNG|nr:hypothetical protein GGI19_001868 [Coemansia pectinata]
MFPLSPFQTLPTLIVEMVVEYLEGRPRSELNQDMTEHQNSKAILTPLLSVSECWRAAALSSICDHCELTFDHRHQVAKVTIPALPADFSYRGFRQAPLVKRVMVTANLWRDMCDGAFCKTMSTVLYESLLFPSASVLWVCLDEDEDEDYDSDSDSDSDSEITQEQVTRFACSLLKLVPNATCVAVKLLVINNSTLEVLDIERVEESDWRNLIYGSTDVPATYTNLTYFDIHILDVPYSSTWAAIADTTPFPILSSLGIYDYYPFDDDVLFRGNGGTLQYLCIPFSALARSVFGRFDIFKRSGVRRMNRISIGKVTNEDDAFLEGNADGHIGRSLQRVYEVAATLRVKNDSSERHMFNALKSAPRLANIQHLYFSRETFKLDDLVCLVAALPSLVSISCTVSGIGPEIEAISEDKRPSSLRTKHYPLSNNFRKLRILTSSNTPTQDIAYIGMLLAVLCPKFGHVDLSSELRYMFNREIAWAMINDPFRPYSSCLERLVYR